MRWNREARDGIRYSLYPILVDVCHYFRLFSCSCFLFNFRFFYSFPRRRFETLWRVNWVPKAFFHGCRVSNSVFICTAVPFSER